MELKYLAFFLLVGLVLAQEENACGEEEIEACVTNYSNYAVLNPTEEEACSQVERFLGCIHDGIAKCDPETLEDNILEDISDLEFMSALNCQEAANVLADDAEQCFKDHDTYFADCLPIALQETLKIASEHEGADENVVACSIYTLSISCALDRIDEKCGEKAKDDFMKKIKDIPEEIKEACLSESNLKFFGVSLLEKRKRKK